jgi:hypothetical protein
MKIQLAHEAEKELVESYNWYEDQKEGLGKYFLEFFNMACQDILKSPLAYVKFHEFYQKPLSKFPFVLVYDISDELVTIYAVFHTSRNPKNKW